MASAAASSNGSASAAPQPSPPTEKGLTGVAAEQQVFRAHNQPTPMASEDISAALRDQAAAFERLSKEMKKAASRKTDAPEAAIGSPTPPTPEQAQKLRESVERDIAAGKLEQKVLVGGDVAYSIPLNGVRALGYELTRSRTAFVDRGSHLEVMGASDLHMKAAVDHAARKWSGDKVIVHAQGKALDKIIEHSVRAGLTIVNTEPEVQQKVAAERERQQNPLRQRSMEVNAPVIERVARSA